MAKKSKRILVIAAIAVIFLFGLLYSRNESSQAMTVPDLYADTSAKISPTMEKYLKTNPRYSDLYEKDKKIAIYFTEIDRPFSRCFIKAINSVIKDPKYQQFYNFVPGEDRRGIKMYATKEEKINEEKFNRLCYKLCIVNPSKKEIYALGWRDEKKSANILAVFENLKDW